MDAIRSVDDIEKVEFIINEKKALLKKSKDVQESDRLFAELDGLEWLERRIARYSSRKNKDKQSQIHRCSIYAARS